MRITFLCFIYALTLKFCNFIVAIETVLVPKNITKCQMFTVGCTFRVNVSSNAIDCLTISSSNQHRLTLESVKYKYVDAVDVDIENETSEYHNTYREIEITVIPHMTGRIHLWFNLSSTYCINSTTSKLESIEYPILVISAQRLIDIIQQYYVLVFSIFISILMGILLDREKLVKMIKMPKAVIIGFICQYMFMPVIAYGVVKIFKFPAVEALALFIYGCSPGSSGSNNWTIIFNGDLDLSAILTFISTLSSLFMMPAWLYTLGSTFIRDSNIKIPFFSLFTNLLAVVVPCLLGMILNKFLPKSKTYATKIAKPIVLIFVGGFVILTVATKYYMFRFIRLNQWASALVPWSGFLTSSVFTYLLRFSNSQILTIGLETGIQNIGIAFIIISLNFPSPERDHAIIPLITVSILVSIPLWIALFGLKLNKLRKSRIEKTSINKFDFDTVQSEKLMNQDADFKNSTKIEIIDKKF